MKESLSKLSTCALAMVILITITRVVYGSDPIFGPTMTYPAGTWPHSVKVGDFNEDGCQDLVIGSWTGNSYSILPGDCSGAFDSLIVNSLGGRSHEVLIDDFNKDHHEDLMFSITNQHQAALFIGEGTGDFSLSLNVPSYMGPMGMEKGNFNEDTNTDVVITNWSTSDISIHLGQDGGTFEPPVYYSVGSHPNSVGIGDFNEDSYQDVCVANNSGNSVTILLGDGGGAFSLYEEIPVAELPGELTVCDFNNDQHQDIAVACNPGQEVVVLFGDGSGGMPNQLSSPMTGNPSAIIGHDLNMDTYIDLAVVWGSPDSLSILLGDGSGEIKEIQNYPINGAGMVDVGDFNNDQLPDLAICSSGSNEVSILLNVTTLTAFVDITSSAGVGDEGSSRGVAWGDYDNDGFVDLYVCNMGEYNVLYRNNGDGTFEDVSFVSGTAHPGDCVGAAWGDYDNDGDLDLFLANSNNQANVLFRNNGDGVFTDVSVSAGIIELRESRSAAWGDYDRDGFLDLFVANQSDNTLYHNLEDGTFENVTAEAGVAGAGDSRGSSWGDYDGDGYLDLYIANGGVSNTQNELFKNNGNGSFDEVSEEAGVNDTRRSQGIAWGDYNNDGFLDLYVSNGGYEGQRNTLYENNGDGTFTDVTNTADTGDGKAGVGVAWGDFGNDGFLDLYIVNRDTANVLYINNGDWTFTNVSDSTGVADGGPGRGVALADFDNDGGLDLYVANFDSSNVLYKNIDFPGGWLHVKTVGMRSNKDGVGARVRVFSEQGTVSGEVCTGTGFGSMNSLMMEAGLGEAGVIDSLHIEWPSGIRQRTEELETDQVITIEETWPVIEASPESVFVEPGETFGLTLAVENSSLEYPTIKLQVSIIAVLNNGMEITVLRPVPRFGFSLPAEGRVEATFGLAVPDNLPVGFNCTLKSVLLDYKTGFVINEDDTYAEVIETINGNYGRETSSNYTFENTNTGDILFQVLSQDFR